MATKGKTAKQDRALALLARGPVTVREARADGGPALVRAFCLLTKHKAARVVYADGAYRMARPCAGASCEVDCDFDPNQIGGAL